MLDKYSLSEIINFFENRNFENFSIKDNYAWICSQNIGELILEAPDNNISDEDITLAVEVLKNLDECVKKAYRWLEHFNLKNDKWHSDALDKGFEISGLYFGKYGYGHKHMLSLTDGFTVTYGFTITFSTINYYPCEFTVKFHKNMVPFSVEEWVL